MLSRLPVDADRLWDEIMALAAISDPERPDTRRSFTPLYQQGREWLTRRFTEADLEVRIDAAGNLIGRRAGADSDLKAIVLGSHSDTVPSGGRFDGIAGVIAALETARSLKNAGVVLRHPLEVVDFLAEEPSEFGLSCVGSRGMTGVLEPSMLALKRPGNEPLADALRRVGGDPSRLAEAKREDVGVFIELHIEQGVVLESEGVDVGVVMSIVGIRRMEIAFEGEADHAGTTPMTLRRDALVAAARIVDSVRRAADALATEGAELLCGDGRHSRRYAVGLQCRARLQPTHRRRPLHLTGDDATLRRPDRPRERRARQGGGRKAHALRHPRRQPASSLRSRSARGASPCSAAARPERARTRERRRT
jgi:beta-ureidopropionase / N-carbamoyl-L-amino-acid hydrolase